MGLQKTVFGRVKYKPNTFIGGVGAITNTPVLLAARLNTSVNNIKAFSVIGNDVQCAVVNNYSIGWNQWDNRSDLTYYRDEGGKCVLVAGQRTFANCINLVEVLLPKAQLYEILSNTYTWVYNPKLSKLILPTTTTFPQNSIHSTDLVELNLDNVVTFQGAAVNGALNKLTVLNIKKCKSFGTTGPTGPSNAFRGINTPKIGMTFNVNIALLTSNAGAVNADMLFYKTNYSCVINFYDDNGNYVSTL
jgi:hypothetical protein